MNRLIKTFLTGLMLMTGVFGFVSGEYIITSALLAVTTYLSAINAGSGQSRR